MFPRGGANKELPDMVSSQVKDDKDFQGDEHYFTMVRNKSKKEAD